VDSAVCLVSYTRKKQKGHARSIIDIPQHQKIGLAYGEKELLDSSSASSLAFCWNSVSHGDFGLVIDDDSPRRLVRVRRCLLPWISGDRLPHQAANRNDEPTIEAIFISFGYRDYRGKE
jgi:hypothetical protein